MKKTTTGIAMGVIGVALLLIAGWINLEVLSEAFGSGPPYYSRTINMDKWTNPLPYLIPADVVVLVLAALALRYSVKSFLSRGSLASDS